MAGSTPFAAKGVIGFIHQHAWTKGSILQLPKVDLGNSLLPVTMQMIDQQLPR